MASSARKHEKEFQDLLKQSAILDKTTGNLRFKGMYVAVSLTFAYDSSIISLPYSHVVWFLTRGSWPREGYFIDHINNDALDNSPTNFQELTRKAHAEKHRGTRVFRNYGSGKYGHGIGVLRDKRVGRYYVSRTLSRGHTGGVEIRKSLGGYPTLKAAEKAIAGFIAEIEKNSPGHMPKYESKNRSRSEIVANMDQFIALRAQGKTIREIAEETGFSIGTVHSKTKHMGVDKRCAIGEDRASGNIKLTEDKVREIRRMFRDKVKVNEIAAKVGVKRSQIYNVVNGVVWGHVI